MPVDIVLELPDAIIEHLERLALANATTVEIEAYKIIVGNAYLTTQEQQTAEAWNSSDNPTEKQVD